jgi:hypothetical protein
MIKILIMILMLSSCSQTSSNSKDYLIEKIVIKKVDFSIYTIVSVKCDDFEAHFKDEYLISTLSNKKDIDNFLAIFKDSIPLDSSFDNYIVDTRVKAEIYYNDGGIENICIGNPAYKKNGIFYQNSDNIREYIENIKPD